MDHSSFIDDLYSVLSGMSSKETHALIYVATYLGLNSPTRFKLALELQSQTNIAAVCTELPSGDYLVLLKQISLDGALLIARQVRYAIDRAIQPDFELAGSFGIIGFGKFVDGCDDLIMRAKRAAMEASKNHQNRIKYLTIS